MLRPSTISEPPSSLDPTAYASFNFRQSSPLRVPELDDHFCSQLVDLAELAHTADVAYWIMLRPIIKHLDSISCLPHRSRTVTNAQSVSVFKSIAQANAMDPLQSRFAASAFLIGQPFLL